MALVTTTIDASSRYIPFERPPDAAVLRTAIPRGLRIFSAVSVALDAKPINDTQLLIVQGELPRNFAYVIADLMLSVTVNVAPNWERECRLNLRNWLPGLPAIDGDWMMNVGDIGGDGRLVLFAESVDLPRFPLRGSQELSPVAFSLISRNVAAPAGTAGTVRFYLSFYEYDLAQIQYFPANFAPSVQLR